MIVDAHSLLDSIDEMMKLTKEELNDLDVLRSSLEKHTRLDKTAVEMSVLVAEIVTALSLLRNSFDTIDKFLCRSEEWQNLRSTMDLQTHGIEKFFVDQLSQNDLCLLQLAALDAACCDSGGFVACCAHLSGLSGASDALDSTLLSLDKNLQLRSRSLKRSEIGDSNAETLSDYSSFEEAELLPTNPLIVYPKSEFGSLRNFLAIVKILKSHPRQHR
ncbi:hypothetical protein NECAME_04091 [Necator americanus]|uniref:Uncharacterized protein n=1 Tax=Necator americanus TaxID=51031 RepID=W2SZ37_NECAM|nr:hypothetical protein NECAME_04091 [Necator americanus]ETN74226.1 hypothetical protein NECAME_04091 [Necator americanus]